MTKKRSKKKLSFYAVLCMFALIPLIVVSVALGFAAINIADKEITMHINNSMISSVKQIGVAFDDEIADTKETMAEYATAPVIQEYLKNMDDPAMAERAEQYTLNFFGNLHGWEGLYLADWDAKVLTHPVQDVIGSVLREGDSLEQLRNSMLEADGVYNAGIINSPASGQLVMSLYMPVFDGDQPIGYVGAATFVNEVAAAYSDVSSMGLETAYTYFVSPTGTMLFHPTPEKIGQPVENAAVKKLVADLANGVHPEPACIDYVFKGATKYAAYYIDAEETYIAVVTADQADILKSTTHIRNYVLFILLAAVIVVGLISIVLAKRIGSPLIELAKITETLSTGDMTVKCTTKSSINETSSVINSFAALTTALTQSIGNVKQSASVLRDSILSVDSMTADNVQSITQINEAINEVSATSQTVASNAQNMAEKNLILEKNVEDLNENVSILLSAAQTIKTVNGEASECMTSVYEGSRDSVNAIHNIAAKINETNSAVENISKAVVSIEAIAEQTNLLSLNASIEAARAGEAGKGFAVVADEIRTLADSSAESAKEIKVIIESILSLSKETVEISNEVFEVISKEQSDIEITQSKFNELLESIDASLVEINKINDMSSSLDAVKNDMTSAISELSAVSQELGASAEEVAASCQIVTGACTNTQNSTEGMRAVNDSMTAAIEFFKMNEDAQSDL